LKLAPIAAGPTALARPWNIDTASAASWLPTLSASCALTSAMRCVASAFTASAILAVSTTGLAGPALLQAPSDAAISAAVAATAIWVLVIA
jgi:hypothetical protein